MELWPWKMRGVYSSKYGGVREEALKNHRGCWWGVQGSDEGIGRIAICDPS